jgi:hypothetical protein
VAAAAVTSTKRKRDISTQDFNRALMIKQPIIKQNNLSNEKEMDLNKIY